MKLAELFEKAALALQRKENLDFLIRVAVWLEKNSRLIEKNPRLVKVFQDVYSDLLPHPPLTVRGVILNLEGTTHSLRLLAKIGNPDFTREAILFETQFLRTAARLLRSSNLNL